MRSDLELVLLQGQECPGRERRPVRLRRRVDVAAICADINRRLQSAKKLPAATIPSQMPKIRPPRREGGRREITHYHLERHRPAIPKLVRDFVDASPVRYPWPSPRMRACPPSAAGGDTQPSSARTPQAAEQATRSPSVVLGLRERVCRLLLATFRGLSRSLGV